MVSHRRYKRCGAIPKQNKIKGGLALTATQIRCSSVDGYRLPIGVNTQDKLREEVNAAKVVVGLVTPHSLTSYYVMFELGARWGANLFLAPLVAGVKAGHLSGPLSLLNALSAHSDAQLHQLLDDIAHHLGLQVQPAASYIRNVTAVKALADAMANPVTAKSVAATPAKPKLRLAVSAEGTPPSQVLKVVANQQVEVSRVEYMLSNETTICGEDVSQQGESVEIPVNDALVVRVWNTPRHDRNFSDHSGPAKIGVTVSVDGEPHQYVLPIQMESWFQNNTAHRKLVARRRSMARKATRRCTVRAYHFIPCGYALDNLRIPYVSLPLNDRGSEHRGDLLSTHRSILSCSKQSPFLFGLQAGAS